MVGASHCGGSSSLFPSLRVLFGVGLALCGVLGVFGVVRADGGALEVALRGVWGSRVAEAGAGRVLSR